jgi:predicted lipoprotein with Yx(FWY)xxD motif
MKKLILTSLALVLAIGLAACGGSSNDNAATASSGTPSTTVGLDNGLLVDSTGAALYTSEQEKSGTVMCTGGCTQIWLPLKAPASGQPTAGDGVSGKLGTVKRPDGARQVTLDGRPLYRFAEDTQKGKATGDNVSDSFGGQKFTWHAEGDASSSSGSGNSGGGNSGGSGSGAYNY